MKTPTLYLKLAMPLLATSFAVLAEPPPCITEQQQLQQSLLQHQPIDPAVMNLVLSLQHDGMSLCRTGNVADGAAKLNEALKKKRPLVAPQPQPITSMQSAMFGYTSLEQAENYTIQVITDYSYIEVSNKSLSESGQVAYYGYFYDNNVNKGFRGFRWGVDGMLTNLGTLSTDSNGWGYSVAYSINARGQVAGHSGLYNNDVYKGNDAIRWEGDGTLTNLGSLGTDSNGYRAGSAEAINANGQVGGYSELIDNNVYKGRRAIRSEADGTLGSLSTDSNGYGEAIARAINASGQVAGESRVFDNNTFKGWRAFRSNADGTLTNLGSLGTDSDNGNGYSLANAINASGQVAGYSWLSDNNGFKGGRAIRWEVDGTLTNLGSLGTDSNGLGESTATNINANSQVAGNSDLYENNVYKGIRAFISQSGQLIQALPLLGECANEPRTVAYDLNDQGQVVGYSSTADCNQHAFLYDIATKTLSDLNDFLPANSGWIFANAIAINEAGQILVYGYEQNRFRLALLSPVHDTSLKVLYPNGGETLMVGIKATLKWHSSNTLVDSKQRVTVLFSKNSGVSWFIIHDNIKNTETYQWKPNKNDYTTQGRIKVCQTKVDDLDDKRNKKKPPSLRVCDESDANFKIVKK